MLRYLTKSVCASGVRPAVAENMGSKRGVNCDWVADERCELSCFHTSEGTRKVAKVWVYNRWSIKVEEKGESIL
jgi:hypothetical protein